MIFPGSLFLVLSEVVETDGSEVTSAIIKQDILKDDLNQLNKEIKLLLFFNSNRFCCTNNQRESESEKNESLNYSFTHQVPGSIAFSAQSFQTQVFQEDKIRESFEDKRRGASALNVGFIQLENVHKCHFQIGQSSMCIEDLPSKYGFDTRRRSI